MAINVGDNFSYQGKKYLDNRQSFKTLSELQAYSNVPEGFIAYCEEDKKRYEYVDGVWTEYVVASSGTGVNPDCATKAYVDGLIESHTHDEYLTEHQDISHLATKAEIPSLEGLATETYVQEQIANAELGGEEVDLSGYVTEQELEQKGYLTEHQDISHLATKAEIPSIEGLATETYVQEQIANASLGGGDGSVDISNFATKDDLKTKFDDVEVNEEETTDSQTALDFFANGEKVKTVYFSGGGGGSAAAAYISTTLPEEAMVETGYDFDILLDFYSPNPGKGTLKVFVNDLDALSTPIIQGETTTTLSHEKLTKGTNKIVVYVLDRIGTMSNSLTFYVRYGSTELVGEFDSSLSYDYGANIRYYFTATALDTSLGLTFYMSIDGAVQNGVSCVSDVRGYFTFPNSLEAGGHYCECWVEDSKGGKSNIETFNLVILDTNTLAIVTETRNPSVEEGSQLVLDYRVYKKNETTFIIKTYVDEELVSTGTCGLTTSYYKTTTLREGMHNIKIEAWDITETVSDYVTWSVIITPSTYTMLEPIKAGSMFMATAKNRTNGDPNRETWTGYDQDNNAIDCTLYNFAFNSESGWMDDQLFITGNSYVEIPIQPLANNARYGFTLDVEFSTKPIGVDDAEVLSLWNDTDNCGIKITTDQLILQSKTGNKCELYFSENEIVSAIFIIDRHEKTAKVYLNGVMCAAFALSDYVVEGEQHLEDFTVNDNLYLGKPGSNGYATIKNLRIYELALSSSEILNNFMANEIDKAKQQALVNFQKGEDLPTVTVYCDFSGLGKDDKKYCDIVYNSPDPVKYGESFSLMGKYSQLQYQGTSSMQYPIKNYRLNPKDANGKVKIKLPNSQPETRFTLKADFMSSGHWQNTGLTKWINDNLYNYKEDDPKTMNPAKWWAIQNGKDPNDYRECIYGFPCRLILVNDGTSPLNEGQQEPTPGNTKDMGIFNFNLDKDCENSLGFKIKDFPNALSMEVTANSDTSAGAFMSHEQTIPSFYENQTPDDPENNSGGSTTTALIDIDMFSGDSITISGIRRNGEGGGMNLASYTCYDSDNVIIKQKSNIYTGSHTINIADIPSTTKYISFVFTWGRAKSVKINDKNYQIDWSIPVSPSDLTEFSKYNITKESWDGATLDYIKESFELRYPDEDDVPEGWGFMGMDVPETAMSFGYWDEGGARVSSLFAKPDSITIETQNGSNFGFALFTRNDGADQGVWLGNYDDYTSGSTINLTQYSGTYIAIRSLNGLGDEYIVINGVKHHFSHTVNASTIEEPQPFETGETVFDTSYGLKSLIDWVDNSTDEQFVAEFEEHFHKDYTLRYFLLVMVLGMVDNLGKNMMLDSYDGKIWMPRFYDCDTICSYDNSGAIKFDVDIEMQQGYWNTSSSRLWTRVRDLLHDELVVKYNDMRQNGLSFESLMSVFYDEQIAKIPQKYYNMDADVKYLPYADEYLGKAHGDGYEHLKRWLKNRIIFTDSLYDYAPSYTNDMITFRANTTEEMTITIETYTPVYQHVSWYNGNMQKEKIAKGTQLTFKGFAQAATDQEVLVYGGSNIKRIIGVSTMNPNSMLIGNATRLVELDISDCPILTDINSNKANFTPHTYLNKLDISNCPQLGGSLRLNYSPLIGEINAMNTAVTDLQLPSSIRNLHTLKVPGALTNLTLNDGPVLSTLEFDGPNNLQSVNLTNCNALTNVVNFDMTQIPSVTLNNSYDADELYMSKTTNLSLVNMANIKRLIFLPNNEHETFNLTQLRNYPDYTISAINCPSLKTFMTTAGYRESYKLISFKEVVDYDNYTNVMPSNIEIQRNSWIHGDNGTLNNAGSPTSCVTYIPVNSGKTYTLGTNDSSGVLQLLIYDNNKNYQREDSVTFFGDHTMPLTFTVPDGCGFIRFHINNGTFDGSSDVFLKMYETKTIQVIDYGDVAPNTAFCANTLDISNTKITDVNFLCTTDVYQLKLPDTVNNFICDSAYDLDTDYLPDGDFDTVHHEQIEAYTTNYGRNVTKGVETEIRNEPFEVGYYIDDNGNKIKSSNSTTSEVFYVKGGTTVHFESSSMLYSGGNGIRAIQYNDSDEILKIDMYTGSWVDYANNGATIVLEPNTSRFRITVIISQHSGSKFTDTPITYITYHRAYAPNLIPSAADGSLIFSMYAPNTNVAVPAEGIWDLYGLTFEEFYTYGMNNDIVENVPPETTIPVTFYNGYDREYTSFYIDINDLLNDGVITVRRNDAIDDSCIFFYKDDTRLSSPTFGTTDTIITPPDEANRVQFFIVRPRGTTDFPSQPIIYLNNAFKLNINVVANSTDLIVPIFEQDVIITMPHRYADYNITIQNANIKPTNHPTMLYPLLVNEDKPILGTIDYSDYQGDDLSYAMAYANKAEVDISIPNDVVMNTQYFHGIDLGSEYEYNDPRSIAKYTCNAKGVLPTFNSGYSAYRVSERDNGDGTYTTSIIADDISNLPTSINFRDKKEVLSIGYLNTSGLTTMQDMFRGCSSLSYINTDDWDISNVTTMADSFRETAITSINLNNLNSENVGNTQSMFWGCTKLQSANLSGLVQGRNDNISAMFQNCSSLTSLDLSGWDTSGVVYVYNMFQSCTSLTSLDLSSWDTSSVVAMNNMFQNCKSLTSLDVSNWDVSSVTSINSIFAYCSSLTSMNLNGWKLDKIESIYGLFLGCTSLENVDVSTLDLSLCKTMFDCFSGCKSLKKLDIRNWNVRSDSNARTMFGGCSSLSEIYWDDWPLTVDVSICNLNKDVLLDMLENLATVTNSTTLTLGSTNLAKLTDSDKAIAVNKGWTLA